MAASEVPASEGILLREDADGITTLTLNRPAQFNALSEALVDALAATLDAVGRDPAVRVVVIAGAGRAFCAGHDLREMRSRPDAAWYRDLFARCAAMMQTLPRLPQPVIARVHGVATAAGCQLVASADLAVASRTARFATSGINLGLFCATPGVALSRNLARKHAFEMLFTGEFVGAERAAVLGLVNHVVEPDALDAEVAKLAGRLRDQPREAVRLGKALFHRQLGRPLDAAYLDAGAVMADNLLDADAIEGIDAFLEKREPRFGR
ncbi:MAG: enoyl-CoA hydratase [Myxococcota bacterium]